ncbi:MAG: hypothetical protein HOL70_09530 [Candidatus Marinimicrobia bacterium]|jgi:hypothetical protein|nr:hypothetical protein [Candidatus Neomarinimicrobiota bacterium]
MSKEKSRTLFYRRVVWADGASDSLEKHLSKVHDTLITTYDRTFAHGDGEIQGLTVEKTNNGLFVHVASYTPHQPTSLVPFPSKAKSKETSPEPPPNKHNYLEGDIFFLINSNHLVLCPSGARESIALSYINHVLRKSGMEKLLMRFSIEPVAKVDKVKLLQQEGVKKVSLNASLYEATMEYTARKTTKMNLLHGVAEEVIALFAKGDNKELKEIGEMENLSVKLEISFDSRKKGGDLGRKRLEKTADMLIADDEDQGFSIVTGNGKRLTADEIRISDRVKLSTHGNSVFRSSARNALEKYLSDLKASGMLEQ